MHPCAHVYSGGNGFSYRCLYFLAHHPSLWFVFRVQKQRATKSEDAVGHLNAQLMERDAHLADIRAQNDDMRSLLDKISKEKAQIISENSALKTLAFSLIF